VTEDLNPKPRTFESSDGRVYRLNYQPRQEILDRESDPCPSPHRIFPGVQSCQPFTGENPSGAEYHTHNSEGLPHPTQLLRARANIDPEPTDVNFFKSVKEKLNL
jgi:hypothetical protein